MQKALVDAINKVIEQGIVLTSSAQMESAKCAIRRALSKRQRRIVSSGDIVLASRILLRRAQEAECNMCIVTSTRNYYEVKLAHPVVRNSGAHYL
jgi:hypothetical protein